MGRVSEREIERMKAEISLEAVVKRSGVELRKVGNDLRGRCPFHDDAEPSLVVTPAKNLWHCLGECQTGGSVIDWVMRAQGVSYRHALQLLKADIPSLAACSPGAAAPPKAPKRSTVTKLPPPVSADDSEEKLLARVVSFYHSTLKQNEEALSYLKKRGLDDPALIEHFQLGFANRTLAYRLPAKNRADGAKLRTELQQVGILRESGHEHFNGSLVIPVFDEKGRVVEMYGRKVGTRLRKGTPLHLYLPGPHRGVFNRACLEAIHAQNELDEVILCESLMDALTFWAAGFRNVTTSFGVEGFTEELRAFLIEKGVGRVLIAYDSDKAGDKAADKLGAELLALGIECSRVRFPKGMDANEYALKVGPPKKALQTVLDAAEPMGPAVKNTGRADEPEDKSPPVSPPPPAPQATKESADEGKRAAEAAEPAENKDPIPPLAAQTTPEREPLSYSAESDEAHGKMGDRLWRIRGLAKNTTPGILRLNVFVQGASGFFVDSLDLYSARHRASFLKQAASELSLEERILKADMGRLLLSLETLQEQLHKEAQESQNQRVELSDAEQAEALALLKSPDLLSRIERDLDRCGLVGEGKNKLLAYLAASSRKLTQPLAIVVQSSSAAGKSSLMDAVLRMMPEEERVQYSAMTGQSLFYMGETNLSHKILAIAEEEGAERASYALKLLQSEGELTIASTGKDPATGRLVTHEYRVQGPVMIFLTTTALEVDEELLNRCLVLTVDETREQTQAIHERQRRAQTLQGLLEAQERSALMHLHQNAQRLLKPLFVANPYAEELTFSDGQTRTRRDHMKYLTLIQSIALLHQYQRPVKTVEHQGSQLRYIEVTREDIALADQLSADVLRPREDQLPPKTRELLAELSHLVAQQAAKQGTDPVDVRFTRRQLREATQLGDTQLKLHLGRLVEMEHLAIHRDRHSQRFVYSLTAPVSAAHDDEELARESTGRQPVGAGNRPVLVSDDEHLSEPVGDKPKSTSGPKVNGSSYVPAGAFGRAQSLSLVARAAAPGAAE